MIRQITIKIGTKSINCGEFTGTVDECLIEITRLENIHNRPLQHYEVGTGWRIKGGVLQKP